MKTILSLMFLSLSWLAAADIGIVNFGKCIESSKYGRYEQKQFESVKNQLQKAVQDLNDQLTTVANKLQDPDILDSMSPDAEKELRQKFQLLNEEMQRYQSQYYQVMQQANMKLMQAMADQVQEASKTVAKRAKLSLILQKEAALHYTEAFDVTSDVIAEMDKKFDKEGKSLDSKN